MAAATEAAGAGAAKPTGPPHLQLIRDPAIAKSRIFIGNLPSCTREELESICLPYGKVLASMVQKNFGFVQFETEELANRVASALTKSTFKGNIITVRNAGYKPQKPPNTGAPGAPANNSDANGDYNDCEIIVVDRKNTKYAELIEERLKRMGLRVDVLFPNADVPLGKVLSNISSRGCLYAILVTNQHEELNSITVNILYGQPAEHRNMPVEDAINLIFSDFTTKKTTEIRQSRVPQMPKAMPQVLPKSAVFQAPNDHPDTIRSLLDMLRQNKTLTVLQYDTLLAYLKNRREMQLNAELGGTQKAPDPEIQLQKKILNIMSKEYIGDNPHNLLYPKLEVAKADGRLMELLSDERVQKAIDQMMDSNVLATVQKLMKF